MLVTIYHNAACGTSRNTLRAIREAGYEPRIIEYLVTPPTRDELKSLVERMKVSVRDIARKKEPLYSELGLDEKDVEENEMLDAMLANPILINRPIVIAGSLIRLCRPSETVKGLLAEAEQQP